MRQIFFILLVVCVLAALTLVPSPLPSNFPANDFRGYWSASYLLAHGENFTDDQRMFQIELTLTDLKGTYPIVTWNPPWLLALLLPLTFVPFDHALFAWMMTSIALIFASAVMFWQLTTVNEAARRRVWLAVLVAFVYSPTLTTLVAGQVNVLVLAGLVGYLYFGNERRDLLAGLSLALTTIKPQMIYLALPILLLDLIIERRWRALLGFAGLIFGLTLVALSLRPSLPFDYLTAVGKGNLLAYETPTLGGLLDALSGWQGFKLMGLIVLPLTIAIWWRGRAGWDSQTVVEGLIILSTITAPFGWSYDFIVLLIPLWRILAWMVEGRFTRAETLTFSALLLLADLLTYYQRVTTDRELVFVWVPIAVAGLFAYVLIRMKFREASIQD